MSNIKQCRFCVYYDKTRPSYYAEKHRCTKIHRFVDPDNACEHYTDRGLAHIAGELNVQL